MDFFWGDQSFQGFFSYFTKGKHTLMTFPVPHDACLAFTEVNGLLALPLSHNVSQCVTTPQSQKSKNFQKFSKNKTFPISTRGRSPIIFRTISAHEVKWYESYEAETISGAGQKRDSQPKMRPVVNLHHSVVPRSFL